MTIPNAQSTAVRNISCGVKAGSESYFVGGPERPVTHLSFVRLNGDLVAASLEIWAMRDSERSSTEAITVVAQEW